MNWQRDYTHKKYITIPTEVLDEMVKTMEKSGLDVKVE